MALTWLFVGRFQINGLVALRLLIWRVPLARRRARLINNNFLLITSAALEPFQRLIWAPRLPALRLLHRCHLERRFALGLANVLLLLLLLFQVSLVLDAQYAIDGVVGVLLVAQVELLRIILLLLLLVLLLLVVLLLVELMLLDAGVRLVCLIMGDRRIDDDTRRRLQLVIVDRRCGHNRSLLLLLLLVRHRSQQVLLVEVRVVLLLVVVVVLAEVVVRGVVV